MHHEPTLTHHYITTESSILARHQGKQHNCVTTTTDVIRTNIRNLGVPKCFLSRWDNGTTSCNTTSSMDIHHEKLCPDRSICPIHSIHIQRQNYEASQFRVNKTIRRIRKGIRLLIPSLFQLNWKRTMVTLAFFVVLSSPSTTTSSSSFVSLNFISSSSMIIGASAFSIPSFHNCYAATTSQQHLFLESYTSLTLSSSVPIRFRDTRHAVVRKRRKNLSTLTRIRLQQHTPTSSSTAPMMMSPSEPDDAMEWKAVVAAFSMYKAAYGDLKVPQRFVVPDIPPWPQPAWGMRLGKIVQAIRSTGKFVDVPVTDPVTRLERRQKLDQLGFVWNVRRSATEDTAAEDKAIRMEQILTAVQVYTTIYGDAKISESFIVPDNENWPDSVRGLPLGRQLEAIRSSTNQEVRDKLASLGVSMGNPMDVKSQETIDEETPIDDENAVSLQPIPPEKPSLKPEIMKKLDDAAGLQLGAKPSANDVRFQNVYVALATYKHLYGDLSVPQPFVVPTRTSPWPDETWGLRLGARVNAIRSQGTFVSNNPKRRKLLDELGFEWSQPLEGRRGRRVKEKTDTDATAAMVSTDSSTTFRKDSEDTAEDNETDSLSLDSLFDGSFDFGRDFEDEISQEKERNVQSWNLDDARIPSSALSSDAEQDSAAGTDEDEYIEPQSLEETLEDATARAMECGVIEGVTENRRVIKGKREKNIPWFNDDFGDDFVFEDVVEALTIYKSLYGDYSNLTNSDYEIPTPNQISGFLDDNDDENTFDVFNVDASARAAAAIANFEDQGQSDQSEDLIAAEIKRLQSEVERPLETETSITPTLVSSSTVPRKQWPEHLAGMSLGSIVTRIRDGSLEVKHLPQRKKQLDLIGFDWGDPKYFIDVPFEKAMCAMYAYYLIRGDMFVYEDFVMPDEDPWPQALAGYELGKAVKRIRELQNAFEAYHTEKVSLLRTIDFIWFADTVALPLDPNEQEMTPEMLMLSAMGHPDYAKMIDIPMGMPDKIMTDGPFYDIGDEPKLWWREWHNWEYVREYWYQQGRRDNAYALRKMGYPRMADEHEAKYGPGLFAQINRVLQELENTNMEYKTLEERRDYLEQLSYFRQEMLGCTDIHPIEREKLIAEFDTQMLVIVKDTELDLSFELPEDSVEIDYKETNGVEQPAKLGSPQSNNEEMEDEDFFDEDEEYEDEDYDLQDELGLVDDD